MACESLEGFVTLDTEAELVESSCQSCGQRCNQAGIPCPCRWSVWMNAVRRWDQQLPVSYEDLLREEGPDDRQIELDIGRTFPRCEAFGTLRQKSLGRVLRAYSALRPDVGYCQGMNFVAGLLTLASDCEEDAFSVLACLMDKYDLAGFYKASFPLLQRYVLAADNLLFRESPLLHGHLQEQGVLPYLYLHEWLLSLFVDCLPLALVLDIFDAIMRKGLFIVVPVAVCILRSLESAILASQFEEIFRSLKALKRLDEKSACALEMRSVVHRACAMKIPEDILSYLSGESDDIAELNHSESSSEVEVGGSGWLQAVSRAFSVLSPRKRRIRKALERSLPEGSLATDPGDSLLSPKKRPSLAAASPCGAEEPPADTASRHSSPSKAAAARMQCSRRRKPEQLTLEEDDEDKHDASSRSAWRSQCCGSSQRVTSAVRRSCPSSSSPSKRDCSGSPVKVSCFGSPTKKGAAGKFRRGTTKRVVGLES